MKHTTLERLYGATEQWKEKKTMEHASGIWGREPTLELLREVIKPGELVVDLGSGAGYPTRLVAEMVVPGGQVIGFELSDSMLAEAKKLSGPDLVFHKADIAREIPLSDESVDTVVSFMVLHNLDIGDVRSVFRETARILRPNGKAFFLSMNPRALDCRWDLDFMVYDPVSLDAYDAAEDKEGIEVPGIVKSAGGGEKRVHMICHTRSNLLRAIDDAGLRLDSELDLWIDEKTACEKFGAKSVRTLPSTPTFWVAIMEKQRV